jgi:hypothetical protein
MAAMAHAAGTQAGKRRRISARDVVRSAPARRAGTGEDLGSVQVSVVKWCED